MPEKIDYEVMEEGTKFSDGKRTAFVEKKFIEDLKEEDGLLTVKLTIVDEYIPVSDVLDAAEVNQFFRNVPRPDFPCKE